MLACPICSEPLNAVDNGVARGHLVTRRSPGSMLLELFTHAGVGTMITDDSVEKLRPARIEDVRGMLELIEPLEADGTPGLAQTEKQFVEVIERNQAVDDAGRKLWRQDGRPLIFRNFLAANAEKIFDAASTRLSC